jgi:hypothetical protein
MIVDSLHRGAMRPKLFTIMKPGEIHSEIVSLP